MTLFSRKFQSRKQNPLLHYEKMTRRKMKQIGNKIFSWKKVLPLLSIFRPLEDLKELFFQEKDVTIIESTQKEEKPPSRKDGRKQRKKNQLKKEGNIKKIEISSKPCIKEEEDVLDSNPLLLNPFCDFEEFLRPQQRRVGSSNKMTFLEPCYTPLLVSDFSPNRSYSDGLAQRHSDLR